MAVLVNQIVAGKCFVTSTNQVRHVIAVASGKVKYESRGAKSTMLFNNQVEVDVAEFANAVDREVKCDWDKDYPE